MWPLPETKKGVFHVIRLRNSTPSLRLHPEGQIMEMTRKSKDLPILLGCLLLLELLQWLMYQHFVLDQLSP
jgi:hypothetical protein